MSQKTEEIIKGIAKDIESLTFDQNKTTIEEFTQTLKNYQDQLKKYLELNNHVISPNLIGGVDITFEKDNQNLGYACLAVYDLKQQTTVYSKIKEIDISDCNIPYISGFLGFREVAPLIKLIEETPKEYVPDVIMVDGSGIHHPNGFGSASHLGLLLDIPTIGVAKNFLNVEGLTRNLMKKEIDNKLLLPDSYFEIRGDQTNNIYGLAYRTISSKNPLFISIGHKVDLDKALEIVKMTTPNCRIPEPIRQADLLSREYRRNKV
jgi:deoxyinosine 3'endonuclease (endonuclease V)